MVVDLSLWRANSRSTGQAQANGSGDCRITLGRRNPDSSTGRYTREPPDRTHAVRRELSTLRLYHGRGRWGYLSKIAHCCDFPTTPTLSRRIPPVSLCPGERCPGERCPGEQCPSKPWELFTIGHLVRGDRRMMLVVKPKPQKALKVRCPTCGAAPGERCELSTGLPRTEPHRDRV